MKANKIEIVFLIISVMAGIAAIYSPSDYYQKDHQKVQSTKNLYPSPYPYPDPTIVVTNTNDAGSGSLRQAIVDASNGDIVTFAPYLTGQTIHLVSELVVDKSITIFGGDLNPQIKISGDTDNDGDGDTQLMTIPAPNIVSLYSLDFIYGKNNSDTFAGGINNFGNLTIQFCAFDKNAGELGGAVLNKGTVNIMSSSFSNNFGMDGGAILNYTNATANISAVFTQNMAHSSLGGGGAIVNLGNMMIEESEFRENSAAGGGAIANTTDGLISIVHSVFISNTGGLEGGGAIYNVDKLITISDSMFYQNTALSDGGAIFNDTNGSIVLSNTNFIENSTPSNGGAIFNSRGEIEISNGAFVFNSAEMDGGGAIFNSLDATITIDNSFFDQNSAQGSFGAGGAIANIGSLTVNNSEFTQNAAIDGGGAIINSLGGIAFITNSTIFNNTSTDGGGGIATAEASTITTLTNITLSNNSGGGLYIFDGTVHLKNSIVANNTGQTDCYKSSGNISTNLNMLIKNNATGINSCGTPLLTSDPKLGPLNNNGGATQTMALLPSSPAIDAGNDSVCAAAPVSNTSQNGVTRPQGSHCDIGAYEFVPSGPTNVNVTIAGTSMGNYPMNHETSQVLKYLVDGGPVVIGSNNGIEMVASLNQWRRNAAQPADWFTGVAQSMALPVEQITNRYVMPRYNGTNPTLYDAVLMANVDTVPRTITVTIGGTVMGTYPLNPSQSVYATYPIVGGPIVVSSVTGARIVASLYELKRSQAGVPWNGQSEMMGLPSGQLSDKYLLPIYFGAANPATLDARLYFANVDTVATTVEVKIAGVSRGTYLMQPSTSMEVKYLVDGGPVEISSNNGAKIVASLNQWRRNAAEPVEWFTGVAQSMALPVELITDKYVIPRYNGTDPTLYDAVLMANVDSVPRTITVKIGATVMGTYPLNPSQSVYATYPIADGPIIVSSDVGAKIVASLYELKRYQAGVPWNGQSEMMGLPFGQLSDQYLLPIYFGAANPATLDARLYIAVP